jgi:hypothetical protein
MPATPKPALATSQNPVPPAPPAVKPASPIPPAAVPTPRSGATASLIPAPSENLRVALGDTIDNVKAAYDIRSDPTGAQTTFLRAPLSGLMFFFKGPDKLLQEIRADAPFGGSIEGVSIGATTDDVLGKLGQPTMATDLGFDHSKRYWFDIGANTLMLDFDKTGKLERIFYSTKNN